MVAFLYNETRTLYANQTYSMFQPKNSPWISESKATWKSCPSWSSKSSPPSDKQEAVNDRTLMWLSLGVLIVVEVYPAERAVMVHGSGVPADTLTGDDVLEAGDLLPGFTLPLSEIFGA